MSNKICSPSSHHQTKNVAVEIIIKQKRVVVAIIFKQISVAVEIIKQKV
jgi:hypothetical protein